MGSNGQKEPKELSYHQVQQMIKEQIDQIEHETGAQPEEDTRAHNDTECNILAVIKRLFRMRCLHFRKRRRRSGRIGIPEHTDLPGSTEKMTVKTDKNQHH